MRLKLFQKSKRVVRSILLSYLAILMLPLFCSIAVFAASMQVLSRQVRDVAQTSASQLQGMIDSYLKDAALSGRSLLSLESLQLLKYETQPFEGEALFTLSRVQRAMLEQMGANPLLHKMFLVFPANGAVLSNTGIYYGDDFASVCVRELGISYAEWQNATRFNSYRGYRFYGADDSLRVLALLTPAVVKGALPDVMAVVSLDTESLRQTLDGLSADGDFQALLFSQDEILLRSAGAESLTVHSVSHPAGRTILAHVASAVAPISYAFIAPAQGYLRNLQRVTQMIFVYFGVCLLTGTYLAVYLTKRQYTPLQKLAGNVLSQMDRSMEGDEYSVLSRSIATLLDKVQSQERLLEESKHSLESHTLRKLLRGTLSAHQLQDGDPRLGIRFQAGCFFVLLCSVTDAGTLLGERDGEDESVLDLLTLVVSSALSSLPFPGCLTYTTDIDSMAGCIVNLSQPREAVQKQELLLAVRSMQEYIHTTLGISVCTGVSVLHESPEEIPLACREAQEAIEASALFGLQNAVVDYEEAALAGSSSAERFSGQRAEEQLVCNCMRAGDYKGARVLIGRMFSSSMRKGACSLREAKLHMSGFVSAMLAAFEEIRPSLGPDFFDTINPIEKLCEADSIVALEENVYAILDALIAYSNARQQGPRAGREQEIVEYVRTHFGDPNLTVTVIADHFDMGASYLSRLFKKATGSGLLDYIHMLRIAKAKRLMQTTPLSCKEIALQIGYTNTLTMTRAFRKLEGVTPSLYKETLAREASS